MKTVIISVLTLFVFPLFSGEISVLVASKNEHKVLAAKQAFCERFPEDEIKWVSSFTDSEVPEQPIGKDVALRGARNRINNLSQALLEQVDYVVSIENYIEKDLTFHRWQDIGLVLVKKLSTQEEIVTLSQGVFIPDYFVLMAKELSSKVLEEGYSCTVGSVIKGDGRIDSHDWQVEAEFGGISREVLLRDAISKALCQEEIIYLKSFIKSYEDFPKPGVLFDDFSPLLNDSKAFSLCIDLLYEHYKNKKIEAIVGLESRGFILGAALAYKLGIGFIPVRKPGKIPGPTYSITYEKEYGVDTLAVSTKAMEENLRVLIVDDLIATGGTARAAVELVRLSGAKPVEFVSLLEIKSLGGRVKLGIPTFNLID